MKERPIIMSAESVRAILDGRKTQTRRVVKLPEGFGPDDVSYFDDDGAGKHLLVTVYGADGSDIMSPILRCPFGAPGDRLWVRETFALESNAGIDCWDSYPPPLDDDRPILWEEDEDCGRVWTVPHYRATDPEPHLIGIDEPRDDPYDDRTRWRPSIHMPRWASRLTLELADVRVERLQDITCGGTMLKSDVVREGAPEEVWGCHEAEASWFRKAWDTINGKRPGCSWEESPWVWVLTFQRVTEAT